MSQREDRVPPVEAKPLLADVIVRNITNLSRLRLQAARRRTLQEHLAEIQRLHDRVLQRQTGAELGAARS
jgi:hypothetical protein